MEHMKQGEIFDLEGNPKVSEDNPQPEQVKSITESLSEEELAELDQRDPDDYMRGQY